MLALSLLAISVLGLIGVIAFFVIGLGLGLTTKYVIYRFEEFRDGYKKEESDSYKVFVKEELRDADFEEIFALAFFSFGGLAICCLVGLVMILPFLS